MKTILVIGKKIIRSESSKSVLMKQAVHHGVRLKVRWPNQKASRTYKQRVTRPLRNNDIGRENESLSEPDSETTGGEEID